MEKVRLIEVTPDNVYDQTLFCVRDIKSPAFETKCAWFLERYKEGLRIKILRGLNERAICFIEYLPAQFAWRPVEASGYMFIHCMYVYSNKDKHKRYASLMLKECEEDARKLGIYGTTVMTSKGSWIADKRLFEKNGYEELDRRDRFELMGKKFDLRYPDPKLLDWTLKQENYQGWHLLYANQCPWHEKSALDLKETAAAYGINLKVKRITTSDEARTGPSGSGVFALLYNGKLLGDHYLSSTRFKNILK